MEEYWRLWENRRQLGARQDIVQNSDRLNGRAGEFAYFEGRAKPRPLCQLHDALTYRPSTIFPWNT